MERGRERKEIMKEEREREGEEIMIGKREKRKR